MVYVDVSGDLDLPARELLEAAVVTCLHRRPLRGAVDLHRVTFMDCAGAAGLVRCRSRARAQDARLVVVDPSPAVTRVLTPPLRTMLGIARSGPDEEPVKRRMLECICCGRTTAHVPGEQTVAADGQVLVQWWRCTECEEGNAVG